MPSQPKGRGVIGVFTEPKGAQDDFLQLVDNSGNVFAWIDYTGKFFGGFMAGLTALAGGGNQQVQYNNAGVIAGDPILTLSPGSSLNLNASVAATAIANQNSPIFNISGSAWNGSSAISDEWFFQDILGSGTNPTSSLQISHSGSPTSNGVSLWIGSPNAAGAAGPNVNADFVLDGSKSPFSGFSANLKSVALFPQTIVLQVNAHDPSGSGASSYTGNNFTTQGDNDNFVTGGQFITECTNAKSTGQFGLYSALYMNVPSGFTNVNIQPAVTGQAVSEGLGTIGILAGFQSSNFCNAAGVINMFTGYYANLNVKSAGTVHNSYGYHCDDLQSAGPVGDTLNAAFHCDAQTNGGYGIYVTGGHSYFGGPVIVDSATVAGSGTQLVLGTSSGFGNGSSGQAVTTTAVGTGTGPTTATTIVKYLKISIGSAAYWIPLMQ